MSGRGAGNAKGNRGRPAYAPDPSRFSTHSLIASAIGKGKSVLDVGCNKGYMALFAPGNDFWGIDYSRKDLSEAKANGYSRTFELDLNDYVKYRTDRKFDVIIFADVLEHLHDPKGCCGYFSDNFLKPGGRVIVSLPNVANAKIRMGLLLGEFDYTPTGILDSTHLHFYTRRTARKLLGSCGLEIISERYGSDRFGRLISGLPGLSTLLAHGFVFVCRRKRRS